MWVSAVLHPAVLLAFADVAGFLQRGDRQPRSVRIAGRLSFVVSIEITPAGTTPSALLLVPSGWHRAGIANVEGRPRSPVPGQVCGQLLIGFHELPR